MAHRAGYAVITGRPNVGKSTLLNALVGAKVAIVTPKPQTTRNRITGIRTLPEAQVVLIDTPGVHAARSPLNRRMVDVARRAVHEGDVALWVLDAAAGVTPADRVLAASLGNRRRPTLVALNKIDAVAKSALLPQMEAVSALLPGCEIVPLAACSGEGVPLLLERLIGALPEGPALFPDDAYTTENERFLAQELVCEQLLLALDQEVPYATAVVIDAFTEKPERELVVIQATVLVERPAHKAIVIGAGGRRLRDVGRQARLELEALLGTRVFLELFVRVEGSWARDPERLSQLGL